jgi:hypothetical protein
MLKTVSPLSNAIGALVYKGTWNASANTPTLTSGVGNKGDYYYVSVAGSTNLDGITDWQVGDLALFNGTVWQKIDNTDAVQSVNGQTGVVVLGPNDVGATANTTYVLVGTGLSGGGRLNGNVTLTVGTVPVANVSGAVPNTVNVIAGNFLSGGGPLTGNVTLNVTNVPVANVPGAVPNTVNIIAGTGLIGGGALTGNVTLIASGVPVGNITGLGTMATQNANAVAITGGNATLTTATAKNFVANINISTSSNIGAYSFGTLPYSDTNIYGSFQTDVNTYSQFILHNSNAGASASTDYVVSNDKGTAGASYGDFGINSSGFTGTGNFQKGNAVYIYASSSDFSIGTWSANAIHFIAGSSTNSDAMTINGNNTVTIQTLNQATSANATFATASLPLVPAGYIVINNNGTNVKIPYYAV